MVKLFVIYDLLLVKNGQLQLLSIFILFITFPV